MVRGRAEVCGDTPEFLSARSRLGVLSSGYGLCAYVENLLYNFRQMIFHLWASVSSLTKQGIDLSDF